MFSNKKNDKTKAPNLDYKIFPISKPYGYYPEAVNNAVEEYHRVIEKQKKIINDLQIAINNEKIEKEKMRTEISNMQLQLSMCTVEPIDSLQEDRINTQFENNFHLKEESEEHKEVKSKIIENENKIDELNKNICDGLTINKENATNNTEDDGMDIINSLPDAEEDDFDIDLDDKKNNKIKFNVKNNDSNDMEDLLSGVESDEVSEDSDFNSLIEDNKSNTNSNSNSDDKDYDDFESKFKF